MHGLVHGTIPQATPAVGALTSRGTPAPLLSRVGAGGVQCRGHAPSSLIRSNRATPASRERFLTPGLDKYGYGLWVDSITIGGRRERIAYRPGSIMGANTALYRVVDRDVTVIILGNTNLTDIDEFAPWIARVMLKGPAS